MTAASKNSAYGLARHKLLLHMEKLALSGEKCLPGMRPLADKLGVSLLTANKAVQSLAREGRLQIVPRKGIFLADKPRSLEIALAIEDEKDCVFVKNPGVLRGILDALDEAKCGVRLMPFHRDRPPTHLFGNYKLDACLWYLPYQKTFGALGAVMKKASLPSLAVVQDMPSAAGGPLPEPHVATDFVAMGSRKAELLSGRGHSCVARFNAEPSGCEHRAFLDALKKDNGLCKDSWVIALAETFNAIPSLLEEEQITAATVNCAGEALENVLRLLSSHPAGRRLELILDYSSGLPSLLLKFPELKILSVNCHPSYALGHVGGETILAHLLEGKALQSRKIPPQFKTREEILKGR